MTEQEQKHPRDVRGRVYLPELFRYMEKVQTRDERIDALQAYIAKDPTHAATLQRVIHVAFDKDLVFDLPEGTPPYAPNQAPDYPFAGRSLFKTVRQFERFMEGRDGYVADRNKRERLFISLLESLHNAEAAIMSAMKDKKLHELYPSVTLDVLKAADERLIPANPIDDGSEAKQTSTGEGTQSTTKGKSKSPSSSTGKSGSGSASKSSSTRSGSKKTNTGTANKTTTARQKSAGKTQTNGSTGGNETEEQ